MFSYKNEKKKNYKILSPTNKNHTKETCLLPTLGILIDFVFIIFLVIVLVFSVAEYLFFVL